MDISDTSIWKCCLFDEFFFVAVKLVLFEILHICDWRLAIPIAENKFAAETQKKKQVSRDSTLCSCFINANLPSVGK